MYAKLYNRTVGWLYITLGTMGILSMHVGDYMFFTTTEAWICVGIGVCATSFARIRFRYAVSAAFFGGIVLMTFGLIGLLVPSLTSLAAEPLECAIRVVTGGWGIYVALHDVSLWRNATSAS